jgi:hypothetical protein
MKKALKALIAIMMVMVLLPANSISVHADSPTLLLSATSTNSSSATLESTTLRKGTDDTITVTVAASGDIANVETVAFILSYDITKLTITELTYNTTLPVYNNGINDTVAQVQQNGKINGTFSTVGSGTFSAPSGTIFVTAKFKPSADTTGDVTVKFDSAKYSVTDSTPASFTNLATLLFQVKDAVTGAPEVDINAPVKGNTISDSKYTASVPTGANYSAVKTEWYKTGDETPTTDTTFAANTAYTAKVTLEPSANYYFNGTNATTNATLDLASSLSAARDTAKKEDIVVTLPFKATAPSEYTSLVADPKSFSTQYYNGETFHDDTLKLYAVYDNGNTPRKEVTSSVTMPVVHKGDQKVTFSYSENNVTHTVDVALQNTVLGTDPTSLFTVKNIEKEYGAATDTEALNTAYGYQNGAGLATYTITKSGTTITDSPLPVDVYDVTVTVLGNDTYANKTISLGTLTIKANSNIDAEYSGTSPEYDGASHTVEFGNLKVTDKNGNTLVKDTDYTVVANNGNAMINAGDYDITISGKGNYAGAAGKAVFSITKKVIDPAGLTWSGTDRAYNGTNSANPTISVPASSAVGTDATNLTVSYTTATYDSMYVGDRTISVSGLSLSGSTASNYQLKTVTEITSAGKITPVDQNLSNLAFTSATVLAKGDPVVLKNLVSGVDPKVKLSFAIDTEKSTDGAAEITSNQAGDQILTGLKPGTVYISVSGSGYSVDTDAVNEFNSFTNGKTVEFTVAAKQPHTFASGFAGAGTVIYGDNNNELTRTAALADNPVGTTTTIEYTSSNAEIASVDPSTGLITVHKTTIDEKNVNTPVVITATASENNLYSETAVKYALTIEKRTLEIKPGDLKFTKTYDGNIVAAGHDSGALEISGLLDSDKNKVTVVLKSTTYDTPDVHTKPLPVSFTLNDTTGCYVAKNNSVDVPFEITKATLTTTYTSGTKGTATVTYGDSLNNINISGVTVQWGETTINGSWNIENLTNPNAGYYPDASALFVLPAEYNKDNFKEAHAAVDLTVNKKDIPSKLTDFNVNQKWSIASGTKESVGSGMPQDAGTLTYAIGTAVPGTHTTVDSWNVDANGKVSYTLNMTSASVHDTVTLPVTISSTNYKDTSVNVIVTITDKDVPDVSLTKIVTTYNGNPVTVDMAQPKATFGTPSVSVPGTWAFKTATAAQLTNANADNASDAGYAYTVVFTPTDTANYAVVEKEVSVVIMKSGPTNVPSSPISTSGKTLADAKKLLESAMKPAGSVVFYDADGKEIPDEDLANYTVTANTQYSLSYIPAEDNIANYKRTTMKLVLWNVPVQSNASSGTTQKENVKEKSFLITFLDCKGNTVKIQWVKYGENASAPAGYGYTGYTNVTANKDLRPINCMAGGYVVPNTADKSN